MSPWLSFRVDLVVRQVQLVQGPGRRADPNGQHAGRGTGQPWPRGHGNRNGDGWEIPGRMGEWDEYGK